MTGKKTERVLYVQTSGTDTPERLYSPFVLGMAAIAMGAEASVVFMIKGLTVATKGEAGKIKLGRYPDLKTMMDQAVEAGMKLYVCGQSAELLDLPAGDFIEEAKIIGAATLTDLSLEADSVLTF